MANTTALRQKHRFPLLFLEWFSSVFLEEEGWRAGTAEQRRINRREPELQLSAGLFILHTWYLEVIIAALDDYGDRGSPSSVLLARLRAFGIVELNHRLFYLVLYSRSLHLY